MGGEERKEVGEGTGPEGERGGSMTRTNPTKSTINISSARLGVVQFFPFLNNTQRGIKADGSQNCKFWGLSKLAILAHQQFWDTFGWVFGTQKVSKIASSGDMQNFGAPVILVPIWVFPIEVPTIRTPPPPKKYRPMRKVLYGDGVWFTVRY